MASIFFADDPERTCKCGKGGTVLADVFTRTLEDIDLLMPGESAPRHARSLTWWRDGATFFDPPGMPPPRPLPEVIEWTDELPEHEVDVVELGIAAHRHWEQYRGNPIRLAIDFGDERIETLVGYRPHERYDGDRCVGIGLVPEDGTCVEQWFWRHFYVCDECGTCICGDGERGHIHP